MGKKSKIIVVVILLFLGGSIGLYLAAQPPSIEHLKKHPEDFRFEYFKRNMEMQIALESIIPLGMTEDRVDEILVDGTGTRRTNLRGKVDYESYRKSSLFIKFMQGINSGVPDHMVTVFYDNNGRVKKICAFGPHCPYNKKGEQ